MRTRCLAITLGFAMSVGLLSSAGWATVLEQQPWNVLVPPGWIGQNGAPPGTVSLDATTNTPDPANAFAFRSA